MGRVAYFHNKINQGASKENVIDEMLKVFNRLQQDGN